MLTWLNLFLLRHHKLLRLFRRCERLSGYHFLHGSDNFSSRNFRVNQPYPHTSLYSPMNISGHTGAREKRPEGKGPLSTLPKNPSQIFSRVFSQCRQINFQFPWFNTKYLISTKNYKLIFIRRYFWTSYFKARDHYWARNAFASRWRQLCLLVVL